MLKVKEERLKKGLSQCKLAQLAGINPTSMSRIEAGKEQAFRLRGAKIANALDWKGDVNELFKEVK